MKIIIIVICIAFLSLSCQAVKSATIEKNVEQSALLKSIIGEGFVIGDNEVSYQHLPEMRAVLSSGSNETPQKVNAQLSASGAQVIDTKGDYILFKIPLINSELFKGVGDSTNYSVVLNTLTNDFGILTGVQVVVVTDIAQTDSIAIDYGIEILKQFSHLRTVLFKVSPGVDITKLTAQLKADSRVDNAYPEIIEHLLEPL